MYCKRQILHHPCLNGFKNLAAVLNRLRPRLPLHPQSKRFGASLLLPWREAPKNERKLLGSTQELKARRVCLIHPVNEWSGHWEKTQPHLSCHVLFSVSLPLLTAALQPGKHIHPLHVKSFIYLYFKFASLISFCFSLIYAAVVVLCLFALWNSASPISPSLVRSLRRPCTVFSSTYVFLLGLNLIVPTVRNNQITTKPEASRLRMTVAGLVRGNSVGSQLCQ